MTRAHQWEVNAAVKSGGRNRFWGERQITRKLIQRKGGNHCDGYRIGDSRFSAETQCLPVGGNPVSADNSKHMDRKANRLELRPNRRKGRNLSAQSKTKVPPLCTGGSGLLHTKCVSISVTPPRKVWRIKIIRLIGNETMDTATECDIMMMPQMSRQPEGSTT